LLGFVTHTDWVFNIAKSFEREELSGLR